ncbi:MAG: AAA family ATPase [Deltaproteobacteria bacterium]|nr:AAA family ATPase [Deltaproteobacteria bacterium]
MFESVHFKNFQCLRNLSLAGLGRVNLIAGRNNTGKTAILEGLYLLQRPNHPWLVLKINDFRGFGHFGEAERFLWTSLFYQNDPSQEIELSGLDQEHRLSKLTIRLMERKEDYVPGDLRDSRGEAEVGVLTPKYRGDNLEFDYTGTSGESYISRALISIDGVRFKSSKLPEKSDFIYIPARNLPRPTKDAEIYSKLEMQGKHAFILKALRTVEPRLDRLSVITSAGISIIHGDVGLGRMIPLTMMGDGLGRMLNLLLTISNAEGEAVLVNEIENGLHPAILQPFWDEMAATLTAFDVQLFSTTHSWECFKAAYRAMGAGSHDALRLYLLETIDDNIRARAYHGDIFKSNQPKDAFNG